MTKRRRRRKHVPQRVCIACRAARPKRELVRVVRTPEGEVMIDDTGKRSGRGAYICRQRACWEEALNRDRLRRALKVESLSAQTMGQLLEYVSVL